MSALSRRRILFGGAAVGTGVLLTACTSNDTGGNAQVNTNSGNENAAPGERVVIGFSAPAADHGWIAAITNLFAINNLPTEVQNMVKGAIIVAAVLIQQFNYRSISQLFKR